MSLTAYTTTAQPVATGEKVVFHDQYNTGSSFITHTNNTSSVSLKRAGWYLVGFTATASALAANSGAISFHLYANGDKVNGFEAAQLVSAEDSPVNLAQTQFLVQAKPNCCMITDNLPLTLEIKNDGALAHLVNANITVTRLC